MQFARMMESRLQVMCVHVVGSLKDKPGVRGDWLLLTTVTFAWPTTTAGDDSWYEKGSRKCPLV